MENNSLLALSSGLIGSVITLIISYIIQYYQKKSELSGNINKACYATLLELSFILGAKKGFIEIMDLSNSVIMPIKDAIDSYSDNLDADKKLVFASIISYIICSDLSKNIKQSLKTDLNNLKIRTSSNVIFKDILTLQRYLPNNVLLLISIIKNLEHIIENILIRYVKFIQTNEQELMHPQRLLNDYNIFNEYFYHLDALKDKLKIAGKITSKQVEGIEYMPYRIAILSFVTKLQREDISHIINKIDIDEFKKHIQKK